MAVHTDWRALYDYMLRGRRVLVTGGAGFIGSHLVETLVHLDADVTVFDDLSSGRPSNLPDATNLRLVNGSVLDEAAVAQAVAGVDTVFHLAARVSVPQSVTDPKAYHDVNATGTVNVLEAARRAAVPRFVYSASSSAYGDAPEMPKVETMAERPQSPYAAAKLVGEQYVRAYAACYDIDAISLRYFNIFGPRQNPHSPYSGVIAAFSKMILAGEAPRITGDGSASRDFTYVHNVVHANLLAATLRERTGARLGGEVVNVAVGERRTILELASNMLRLFDRTDLKPTFAPARPGDVAHSLANLDHAKQVIGFTPIVAFEEGLAETCAWYRQSLD
ncbi:MAG TPA: NAD-dependent epimerase/dehydratase family protein [Tepidisphaeraceae bacterium]|jgi:UDP-glucose 4-epimerase